MNKLFLRAGIAFSVAATMVWLSFPRVGAEGFGLDEFDEQRRRPKPGVTAAPSTPTPTPTATSPTATPTAPSGSVTPTPTPTQPPISSGRLYGVLQPKSQYLSSDWNAGMRVRTLEIGWDNYETQDGVFNAEYVQQWRSEYQRMRAAGFEVILDFGLQYPPPWVFNYANSRYVNQYGTSFNGGLAINGVNAIFNQQMRDLQERYVRRVIADFGTDFHSIRLGWGYYGELNYPTASYGGRSNNYWAFDEIAQGRRLGLPLGMTPNPVPGWVPGVASLNHESARLFANWYMNSLKHYHDWQIGLVRSVYSGRLTMLYSSWGIRPGQLDAAIARDLNGTTSPEINGEIQRGFDFERFVLGITDKDVLVYTTWLCATDSGDGGADIAQWSPVHFLAWLAGRNPLGLTVFGESAGNNNYTDMQRAFAQMNKYGLIGLMWAFEPELYDGAHATIAQYQSLISQNP